MVLITQVLCTAQKVFRTSFQLKNKSVLHWFPGHMGKGVKDMQRKLKSVDCIIEVHDARIPFSGRNPESFQTISGLRPHILVYNKKDLADDSVEEVVINRLQSEGTQNVIFTNCRDQHCKGIKRLIPLVQDKLKKAVRHNRSENQDFCLMVIGVPNVGKSSLINALRNKYLFKSNAASVGAKPGITKNVGEKIKISDDPLIYMLDTPGILTPKVPSVDVGMKLALCATIPDKEVGLELVADYCLYWLNKNKNFKYIHYIGLDNPSDEISEILAKYAIKANLIYKGTDAEGRRVLRPNINLAALKFITAFRDGLFGKVTLDIDKLNSPHKNNSHILRRSVGTS